MAFKDVLQNLGKAFKRQDTTSKSSVEAGAVGTSLFGGILDVEFNTDLSGQNGIAIFDQMRKGDATVIAILEAFKSPFLSAKHFIQEGGKTKKDNLMAEFVRKALFERLRGGYKNFARESMSSLDFGFYYFEKVFEVDDDGFIWWKEFAPRVPSAHYLWEMQTKRGWKDGHPQGITQQLPGDTDDVVKDKKKTTQPEIPWEKLIIFTNKQEGSNFEGVSILRAAYKHWYYKDLLYKIQGISAERFGVGIPKAMHKSGITQAVKDKLVELLSNIRANEQAYVLHDEGVEIDILMPKQDVKADSIGAAIAHHDRKIYDSILAGFLNLTNGEGGSNALSKDQSSFYLRSLQGWVDLYTEIMNRQIRELVDLNFQNVENYPGLIVTDIGQVSLDETLNAMKAAVEAGLLTPTLDDEVAVRELLSLPAKTVPELEKEKESNDNQAKEMPEEKEEEGEEKKGKDDESNEKKDLMEQYELDAQMLAAREKKKTTPTQRERTFVKNITEYEKFLNEEYKKYEKVLEVAEDKYQKAVTLIYKNADTIRKDGVLVFAQTPKNRMLMKKAKTVVDEITKKFLVDKFIHSPIQKKLFRVTKKLAIKNIKENERLLQEIQIDEGTFNSFIGGYILNMKGVFFNEPRRISEEILVNFGAQASVNLAVEQAGKIKFNRNVFKLSTITHARRAYTNIIVNQAQKDNFSFYKVVVPTSRMKDVTPSGTTAGLLFGIYTIAQLNKKASKATDGKNSDAVTGLGSHHGSFESYYPIESDMMEEEKEIARIQREKFAKSKK